MSCVTKPIRSRSWFRSTSDDGVAVVENVPGLRAIQPHQQLHQRRLAGAGGPDEGDRVAARHLEGDVGQRRRRGRLVLEADVVERQVVQLRQRHRVERPRLLLHVEDVLEVLQRHLRLAVDVDDVPELLQRAEDEERVDEEREELPDRDRLRVDQVEHQEHDARAQRVDDRALDEAEAADVADLLQLELQDLVGGAVEARDFLRRQAQALHQLDVPQRFGRRARQRRRLGDDRLLDHLDLLAEHRAEDAERRHGQEVDRRDQPVHAPGVDHHEDDADERREQDVDRRRDQLLDVGAHLLQLAERLAAPLVLEHRVRQLQRVLDAVRVEPRAQALGDDVDEVVLEVLGDARDEGDARPPRPAAG